MTRSKGAWLIWGALAFGGCVIVATVIAAAVTNHSAGGFTRDIRSLSEEAGARLPFYAGAISQLNIMVWASAGSLALLAAYMEPVRRQWFSLFGALLFLFAADDSLMLHESGPRRVIPELAFYAVYAVLALILLVGLSQWRFDEGTFAFLLGGALLATSVIVDQTLAHQYIWEDAPKLLGALLWLVVPLLALIQQRTPRVEEPTATDAAQLIE
jgi:hypothetical protein